MGEIVFLLCIAGVGAAYYLEATGYAMPKLDNSGGPAFFPKLICAILVVLILARVIQIIARKDKNRFVYKNLFLGTTGFFTIGVILFVLLMPFLGYIISCFLFLSIVSNALLYAKTKSFGTVKSIIVRELSFLVFVTVLYYFFTHVLYVAFPDGILKSVI